MGGILFYDCKYLFGILLEEINSIYGSCQNSENGEITFSAYNHTLKYRPGLQNGNDIPLKK